MHILIRRGGTIRVLLVLGLFVALTLVPVPGRAADPESTPPSSFEIFSAVFLETLNSVGADIQSVVGQMVGGTQELITALFAPLLPVPKTETPTPTPTQGQGGKITVSTTIPPPQEERQQYTVATSTNGTPTYTTVVEEHNTYVTNPTTIIREGSSGGGNSSGVSLDLFHKQVDSIYDSMGDAADNVREDMDALFADIAASFTTALLTVTGNASVGGDLNVTGTLTAGSLAVSSVSSGGAVQAPYFTATSTSQASTFPYASTTAISSSYASSTSGFFGSLSIGSLSGFLKATAGSIATALVSLTSDISGTLGVGNGGTGATTLSDLVTLGTHTTGAYVNTITGNTQIGVSGVGSETATAVLSINADSIGDTQLAFDTGQNLTTAAAPTFSGLTLTNGTTTNATSTNMFSTLVRGTTGVFDTLSATIATLTGATITNSTTTNATTTTFFSTLARSTNGVVDTLLTVTGNLGVGTSSPFRKFAVTDTVANPQFALAYDGTRYAQFQTDAAGDLSILTTGGNVRLTDSNLFVCASGACPTLSISGTGNLVVENKLTAGSIEQFCPDGYIWVPGLAKYGTLPGFCTMKYEAKNSGGVPVSVPAGTPYVSISQTFARTACEAVGTGYHLISESEWMTIADQIATLPINDIDTDAGLQLATGHSDNAPANALDAGTSATDPVVSGCNLMLDLENAANAYVASSCELRGTGSGGSTDNDKGYYGTGQQWSATGYSAGTANKSQLRTHVLTNGNVIWDIAGDVWEWTDAYVNGTTEKPAAVVDAWQEYTAITDYAALNYARPKNPSWSSTNGIGQYYAGASAGQRAFLRGAAWSNGSPTGVFALGLFLAPSDTSTSVGFRCSR